MQVSPQVQELTRPRMNTIRNSLIMSYFNIFFEKMFCLFIWSLSSHSRFFHSYEDVTIIGEGLHFFLPMFGTHGSEKQWGFFNVPHLLWHGPTLCNGHLRGPVTLTPVAKRLAVELPLIEGISKLIIISQIITALFSYFIFSAFFLFQNIFPSITINL